MYPFVKYQQMKYGQEFLKEKEKIKFICDKAEHDKMRFGCHQDLCQTCEAQMQYLIRDYKKKMGLRTHEINQRN